MEVGSLLDEMELLRAGERSGALLLVLVLSLVVLADQLGASIAGASIQDMEVDSLLDEMEC